MLRRGIGVQKNLRHLFDNLKNDRNGRLSSLVCPTTSAGKDVGGCKTVETTEVTGNNGSKNRLVIQTPQFRVEPVKQPPRVLVSPPKQASQENPNLPEPPSPPSPPIIKASGIAVEPHNLQKTPSPAATRSDPVTKFMLRYPPTRLYTRKRTLPPTSTRPDPAARTKIRKGLRLEQKDLHRLFDTLKNLRNSRTGTLTEFPSPNAGNESAKPKNWESIEAMETADVMDDNEPNIRIFQQTIEPPSLLKTPLHLIPVSNTQVVDAVTGNLSSIEFHNLRKLVSSLELFSHSPLSVSKEIFHWLSQFKSNPYPLRLLTPRAWELLWALEVDTIPSFRSRLIGDIMVAADILLNEEQNIAYIGGLFWNDARKEALTWWKEGTKSPEASPAYWNLGIRMFSLERQPEIAQYWIGKMQEKFGSIDQKTWMPIIMSWNHIYKPRNAWSAYERMRNCARLAGTPIKSAQYDDICMSFLDGGGAAYGLRAYKHMAAEIPASLRLEADTYSQLNTFVESAQGTSESPKALSDISIDALKSLPAKVADKYFYGSWIKNLTEMGRTDLALYLARDVMVKHGFAPDSIHLNWIIQGFLQDGNGRVAEALAEEMIEERLRRVKAKTEPDFDPAFRDWTVASSATVPAMKHRTPKKGVLPAGPPAIAPATVQTFSLLINYQTRRQRMDKVVELSTLMAKAQIPANSFIFNHFLYSLLRTHDLPRLSGTLKILLESPTAQPDLETWHVVWLAMWRRFTQTHRKYADFPTPQELFKDMVRYMPRRTVVMTGKDRARVKRMWWMVIKSFLLAKDLPGVLVALHAGKRLWGIAADGDIVTEVSRGVFKGRNWDQRVTGWARPPVTGEMVERGASEVRELGRNMARRRKTQRARLWNRVKDSEGLLDGLTRLLRMEMGESSRAGQAVQRAKISMGVEGLVID